MAKRPRKPGVSVCFLNSMYVSPILLSMHHILTTQGIFFLICGAWSQTRGLGIYSARELHPQPWRAVLDDKLLMLITQVKEAVLSINTVKLKAFTEANTHPGVTLGSYRQQRFSNHTEGNKLKQYTQTSVSLGK